VPIVELGTQGALITIQPILSKFLLSSDTHQNIVILLAHLAEGHGSLWYGAASVRRQLFSLNFSRTIRPISTKPGRNDAWEKGIPISSHKGAGPFWVPKGAK